MKKIAIIIHGGAGPDSDFIRSNAEKTEEGLKEALLEAYTLLQNGGKAIDAVTLAVKALEDNELFNAGRGSALNINGQVEMDAGIMDGSTQRAGGVALVRNVKNPIEAARAVMSRTNHVLLGGKDAIDFADDVGLSMEDDMYFTTEHQHKEYPSLEEKSVQEMLSRRSKGTVGAVAVDIDGNVASATSTGGTPGALGGRIGDSCIIGAGCYADNNSCAVSGTGDGEFLMTGLVAHSIAMLMELQGMPVSEAARRVVHERNKDIPGDMGVICVDRNADIGIAFNSVRMPRAWIDASGQLHCRIYADPITNTIV